MSTRFVAHVLSYCLGTGTLRLKGRKQRPWLEISRLETERQYFKSQLKTLKLLHDGSLDIYTDRLPTNGFYDKERFRIHGEELYTAYTLLCPRDRQTITPKILDISHHLGAACLWVDQGRMIGKRGSIRGRYSDEEYECFASWFQRLGVDAVVHRNQNQVVQLSFKYATLSNLYDLIQPHIPASLNHLTKMKELRRRTTSGVLT